MCKLLNFALVIFNENVSCYVCCNNIVLPAFFEKIVTIKNNTVVITYKLSNTDCVVLQDCDNICIILYYILTKFDRNQPLKITNFSSISQNNVEWKNKIVNMHEITRTI